MNMVLDRKINLKHILDFSMKTVDRITTIDLRLQDFQYKLP